MNSLWSKPIFQLSCPSVLLRRLAVWGGIGALFSLSLAAQELPEVFKQDAPFINSSSTPAWINFSAAAPSSFANLSFQLIPPFSGASELLVTVIFDEQPSGLLRATLQSGPISQTLSDNLMEGIQGTNKRTLLIKDLSETAPSVFTLQTGSATLPVKRLILTWVKPQTVFADATAQRTLAMRGTVGLRDSELSGGPLPGPVLEFADHFVHAPLQDQPESIGDGITFIVTLDQLPAHVLLASKLMSPSLLNHLTCRINGQGVPAFTTSPPSLRDPAYFWSADPPYYSGWLPASLYLPGSLWHVGDNTIELSQVDFSGQPTAQPMNIKETVLEILFASPPTSTEEVLPSSPTLGDNTPPPPSP